MRGYIVVVIVVAAVLVAMPMMLVDHPAAGQAASTPVEDLFIVRHIDGETTSSVDGQTLAMYATVRSLGADAPDEAIKATAVAWYTLFCYERDKDGEVTSAIGYPEGYGEAYWREAWGEAYDTHISRIRAACEAVRGRTITMDGAPVMALMHGLNGGKTEAYHTLYDHDLPYLHAVDSKWDTAAPQALSTVDISAGEATSILKTMLSTDTLPASSAWFADPVLTDSGNVKKITVCGKPIDGQTVASAFSLPSAAFTVSVQDERVIFTVTGQGHFLGMSLYGATAMANEGAAWEEIVAHYYQGISV